MTFARAPAALLGAALLALPAAARAASPWTPLAPPKNVLPEDPVLLTDGSVLFQDTKSKSGNSGAWWRLAPNAGGSYVNGIWTQLASLPDGYAPTYFAAAVLPDSRLLVSGGQYNGTNPHAVWTNRSAIYSPPANAWTTVAPPPGWKTIGNGASVVLADGTFMLANSRTSQQALLDPNALAWAATGGGKADPNTGEAWTLLPDGSVLTVDTANPRHAERYVAGRWVSAGSTPVPLAAGGQVGPQVLRPDGTMFVAGANGHTAVFDTATSAWTSGPDFPVKNGVQLSAASSSAAVLPDGRVLLAANPGLNQRGLFFYLFNGKTLALVPALPHAASLPAYAVQLLVLPTGQVLEADSANGVTIYTPTGTPNAAWAPVVTKLPATLARGQNALFSGLRLNGMTQAASVGATYQGATNYPIVRITNNATHHVCYIHTQKPNSMAVANLAVVTAHVVLPQIMETGPSRLQVIANGIASAPVALTVE